MPDRAETAPVRRRQAWQDIALGAFLLGAAALFVGLFFVLAGWRFGHGVHVTVAFDDATGLVSDSPVMVAGVTVGRVEKLWVKDGKAEALLDIRRDARIRADVTAVIRSKSLLGEKVVELAHGTAAAPLLAQDDVIARSRSSVEADQLLARIAPVIEKVDPDDVATVFRAAARVLDGDNIDRLERFADRLDTLVASGGPRALSLLDKAEALAPRTEAVLTSLETTLPAFDKLVAHTDVAVLQAPAFMTRTTAFMDHTQKVVSRLDTTLGTPTLSVLRNADTVLVRLPASLDRLDRLADRVNTSLDSVEPTLDKLSLFVSEDNIRRILRDEGIRIRLAP